MRGCCDLATWQVLPGRVAWRGKYMQSFMRLWNIVLAFEGAATQQGFWK